jgi:nitrogenase molybdenum-iron protein NifN
MDIASSSFSEESAIFGGEKNFKSAVDNIMEKYRPEIIGVVTSCLSETIGENVPLYINGYLSEMKDGLGIPIVHVSTPAYSGGQMDGFHKAVRSVVEALSDKSGTTDVSAGKSLNLLPGFVTPADIRHLKEIVTDFGLHSIILPDYSETLDAPVIDEYRLIPEGGTTLDEIRSMGNAGATIEFGTTIPEEQSGGTLLENKFGVENLKMKYPVGIKQTDVFFKALEKYSNTTTPVKYKLERGRLIDAYVDAHKYLFEKKAVIYGDADMVISIAGFILEIGMIPSLVATGAPVSGRIRQEMKAISGKNEDRIVVKEGIDFLEIEELAGALKPDIIIGNSKGYGIAKKLNIPLIRLGFPIHDRVGAQRILSLGYRGTQNIFDLITNSLLDQKQNESKVGYGYM